MLITVVIPCYNEATCLNELYSRLITATDDTKYTYEYIFVDDGSTDDTLHCLAEITKVDSRIRLIELSRNFGHQAALYAGLHFAEGEAVITMDADLQHPPELIPKLLEQWRGGYDVVYTVREYDNDIPLAKKLSSKFFYKAINLLSKTDIHEHSSDFRLMDRIVVNEIINLKENTKFLRGLICWIGFKQAPIYYKADRRFSGKSSYSFSKMFRFAFDGITSFTAIPLHISTITGLLVSFTSFTYGLYALYTKLFTENALPGWASIVVPLMFISGVQLISLGVIGEYLSRVYNETKARPNYIVRKTYGGKS